MQLAHRNCKKATLPLLQQENVTWTAELWRCTACHLGFAAPADFLLGQVAVQVERALQALRDQIQAQADDLDRIYTQDPKLHGMVDALFR